MKKILIIFLISLLLAGGFAGAYYGNEDFKNWVDGRASIELPIVTPPTEDFDSIILNLQQQINQLRSDFSRVENELADALENNILLTLDINQLNQDLTALNSQLSVKTQELSDKQQQLNNALAQTEQDQVLISNLVWEKSILESTIASFNTERNNLNEQIIALQNEKLQLQDTINLLQENISEKDKKISGLKKEILFYKETIDFNVAYNGDNVRSFTFDFELTEESFYPNDWGYIFTFEGQYPNENLKYEFLVSSGTSLVEFTFEDIKSYMPNMPENIYYTVSILVYKHIFETKETVESLLPKTFGIYYTNITGKLELEELSIDYYSRKYSSIVHEVIFNSIFLNNYVIFLNGDVLTSYGSGATSSLLVYALPSNVKDGDIISVVAKGDDIFVFDSEPVNIVFALPELIDFKVVDSELNITATHESVYSFSLLIDEITHYYWSSSFSFDLSEISSQIIGTLSLYGGYNNVLATYTMIVSNVNEYYEVTLEKQ